jgi:hypothetical protein
MESLLGRVRKQAGAERLAAREVSIRATETLDQRRDRSVLGQQDFGIEIEAHLADLGGDRDRRARRAGRDAAEGVDRGGMLLRAVCRA